MKPIPSEMNPDVIPAQVMMDLQMSLGKLEASLLAQDPLMPGHLKASHELLNTYPETVALLDDNEIRALIDAQQSWAKITIVEREAKKAASGRGKKLSEDDL